MNSAVRDGTKEELAEVARLVANVDVFLAGYSVDARINVSLRLAVALAVDHATDVPATKAQFLAFTNTLWDETVAAYQRSGGVA